MTPPSTAQSVSRTVATAADVRSAWLQFQADLQVVRQQPADRTACCAALLEAVRRLPGVAGAGLLTREHDEIELVTDQFFGPVFERPAFQVALKNSARRSLQNDRLQIVPTAEIRNLTSLVFPCQLADGARWAVALAVAVPPDAVAFELMLPFVIARELQRHDEAGRQQRLDFEIDAVSAIVELVTDVTSSEGPRQAAQCVASALQDYLRSTAVVVGFARRNSAAIRLVALSGQAQFERRTQFARHLEAAFAECALRDGLTSFPADETDRHCSVAHRQLAEFRHLHSVVSVPLKTASGALVGIVTVLAPADDQPVALLKNLLQCLSEPLGSALDIVRRAEGGWWSRVTRSVRAATGWRRAAALLLTAAILCLFVPVPYRISTGCVVQPVTRRFSVAPQDGLLRTTFARPGDLVEQGQILAEMVGREIEWELAGLAAEQHQASRERDAHLVKKSIADAELARLEMQRLAVRSELLRYRRDHLEIRSPIDGIVLSGSLDRRENYPVRRGDGLYEIAPLNPLRIELAIPDTDVACVETGMSVWIVLDGLHSEPLEAHVERIRPRSEIRDGENVFVADASVNNSNGRLRPGMLGTARIISHQRKLGWVLFHKPWNAVRRVVGF